MVNVSAEFKTAMKQPIKELQSYIKLPADTYIRSDDDLISVKISGEGGLLKTVMRSFEGRYLGDHNILGLEVQVGIGVKLADSTFEYIDYGSFLVTKIEFNKETGITIATGYDLMIKTMQAYVPFANYPISMESFAAGLASACGLTLASSGITNGSFIISAELFENINGITYREILQQIAEASGSIAMIGTDDQLYLKDVADTSEELTYSNLKKLKLYPEYGPVNSVVLSRQPAEDNIFLKDQVSITANGLTEFKISNNWILDNDREAAITPIYNKMLGLRYYPFEASTEGLGWYEIGDMITIIDDMNNSFVASTMGFSIFVDGGIKEILITKEPSKTVTNYSYAGTIGRRLSNTEIKVDKQNQDIALINEQLQSVSITKQATAPDYPKTNDLWLNTNDNIIYIFNGESWQPTRISQDALLDYYTKAEIDIKDSAITSTVEQTSVIVTELTTDINNNYLTAEQVEAMTDQNSEDITLIKSDITKIKQDATSFQVQITNIVNNGTSKVTNTLVTVDANGMMISKTGEEMSLMLGYLAGQQVGLEVRRNSDKVLSVTNAGVVTENVTVNKYLIIGTKSRIEDYLDGSGVFFIG